MKNPRRFQTQPEKAGLFDKGERNRLLFLSVLFVLVAAMFIGSQMQGGKYAEQAIGELPEEEQFTETVVRTAFDRTQVEGKLSDATADDRVLLESGPYDAMLRFVAEYGQVWFETAEREVLDASRWDELAADPAAHRAEKYRVRGYIEELKSRTRPDGQKEHRGWVRLENGRVAHFALAQLEENLIVDDFVRFDGMFLKLYNAEGEGGWEEGPLIVGARAVRSYPQPEELTEEKLRARLARVQDDSVESITKLEGAAFDANWLLMAMALDREAAGTDWAAAKELNNEMLASIQLDGSEHRGQPFRIPISKNMGARTIDPGENPVRIDRITEGWIGNMTWTAGSGLITYWMPQPAPEIRTAEYIQGRGYFLKNLAYVPVAGGVNVVPFFVVTSLEIFVPTEDRSVNVVLYTVAGVTILLVVLIPLLLLRDRRNSEQLQRELVRRRQERRQRSTGASQARP